MQRAPEPMPAVLRLALLTPAIVLLTLGLPTGTAQAQGPNCRPSNQQACVRLSWQDATRAPASISHPASQPLHRTANGSTWRVAPDLPANAPPAFSFTIVHNPRREAMTLTFRPNGLEPLDYRIDSFPITPCGDGAARQIRGFSISANRDVLLSNILSISRLFHEPNCRNMLRGVGRHFAELLCAYARADGQMVLTRYFREMVRRVMPNAEARFDQCVAVSDRAYANLVVRGANKDVQQAAGNVQELIRVSETIEMALRDSNVAAAAEVSLAQYRAYEVSALNTSLRSNPATGGVRLALRKRAADPFYVQAFAIAGVERTGF